MLISLTDRYPTRSLIQYGRTVCFFPQKETKTFSLLRPSVSSVWKFSCENYTHTLSILANSLGRTHQRHGRVHRGEIARKSGILHCRAGKL